MIGESGDSAGSGAAWPPREWAAGQGAQAEWWRPDPPAEPGPEGLAGGTARGPESRAAFWGVMAFTLILFISPQTIVPALGPLRIALVAAVLAALAHLVLRFSHGQPVTIRTREMWLAASLAAWAVVTVPESYWPGGSVSFLSEVYFKSLAIFWLLANVVNTSARLRRVIWTLAVLAVPLALTGVQHFIVGVFMASGSASKRIVG